MLNKLGCRRIAELRQTRTMQHVMERDGDRGTDRARREKNPCWWLWSINWMLEKVTHSSLSVCLSVCGSIPVSLYLPACSAICLSPVVTAACLAVAMSICMVPRWEHETTLCSFNQVLLGLRCEKSTLYLIIFLKPGQAQPLVALFCC